MGRVEVLEHGQAFLKVGNDRRLNDFTRRLGHQTTHTGKLLHLGRRTTGTGMSHHIDRVDFLRRIRRIRNTFHHFISNDIGAT